MLRLWAQSWKHRVLAETTSKICSPGRVYKGNPLINKVSRFVVPGGGGGRKLASDILVRGVLLDLFLNGFFLHLIAKSEGSGFHLRSLWHAFGPLFVIFVFFENGAPVLAGTLF